jgi:hypothetical protein
VPLEDLVEKDAVHEPAKADAEENAGCAWARGRVTASSATSSGSGRVAAGNALLVAMSPLSPQPRVNRYLGSGDG